MKNKGLSKNMKIARCSTVSEELSVIEYRNMSMP